MVVKSLTKMNEKGRNEIEKGRKYRRAHVRSGFRMDFKKIGSRHSLAG